VFGVLVPCELEEPCVATEIGERVIRLGVSETELEIWNTRETPGEPVFCWELGRDPKLKDFGLALKFVVVSIVTDGREAGDIYLPAIVVLTDTLGKKVTGLGDLKNLVSSLDSGLLRVPQTTSVGECENQIYNCTLRYSLSLLNVNGHTDETTWGNVVWGFLAPTELYSLLGGQHLLQLAQSNTYTLSEHPASEINGNLLTNSWFDIRIRILRVVVEVLTHLRPPFKNTGWMLVRYGRRKGLLFFSPFD
jgi:hypothetical protein